MECIFENMKIRILLIIYFSSSYFLGFLFSSKADNNINYSIQSIIFLVWFVFEIKKTKIRVFDIYKDAFTKIIWKDFLKLIIALILFSFGSVRLIGHLIYQINPQFLISFLQNTTMNSLSAFPKLSKICLFINICLLAPVIEELIFRGVILTRLKMRWGLNIGILLSSILFASIHPRIQFLNILVFGIAWSLLYINNKNIIIPIIAHFLNNISNRIISTLLASFDKSGLITSSLFIVSLLYIIIYIKRTWPTNTKLTM